MSKDTEAPKQMFRDSRALRSRKKRAGEDLQPLAYFDGAFQGDMNGTLRDHRRNIAIHVTKSVFRNDSILNGWRNDPVRVLQVSITFWYAV